MRGGAAQALAFGSFQLDTLRLALPMAALREVLPTAPLAALPGSAAIVAGALDMRGLAVPVLDLRRLLGLPAAPFASVVIVSHEGRLLGLGVDGVGGVFNSFVQPLSDASSGSLLDGTVDDGGSRIALLSAPALAGLAGVPLALDLQVVRETGAGASQAVAPSRPVVLMRCGELPMAVPAMAVEATLDAPVLDTDSALVAGHCRGVIDHGGTPLPALDLLALCGLGRLDLQQPMQAFVLRVGRGRVALLVSAVLDVVRVHAEQLVPVPAFAFPRPGLFGGALAGAGDAAPSLLLDDAALAADPDVAGLAAVHEARVDEAEGRAGQRARRRMITYALAGEAATPIEQVAEILPYRPELTTFRQEGVTLGMLLHRGRAVPVLCLSRLTGAAPPEVTPAASVLLVDSDGTWVGFAVPQLRTIEPASWEPEPRSDAPARAMALLGGGEEERMLPVVDLRTLARQVLQGRMPA